MTAHCLTHGALADSLRGAPWRRLVALGDSIVAGVREPHEGFRDLSWIDRIAAALAAVAPGLAHRNLGRRDLLVAQVREQQLEAALAFRPDLAILSAGGNDMLRRAFAPEAVERELDVMVGALRAAGSDVLTLDLFDITVSPLVAPEHRDPLRERLRQLAEVTRAVAARHGGLHVELRGHPAGADPGIYSSDGLHLNARGHAIVATEAIRRLAAHLQA